MPGLAGSGIPISSSYTVRSHQLFPSLCGLLDFVAYLLHLIMLFCILQFAPSSFGLQQNSISSQFQPMSQMHAHAVPVVGQPWMSSGSQSVAPIPPVQQTGQQPSVISSTDSVIFFFWLFFIHSNHFITKITRVMSFLHAFLFDVST
jgi:hypothetical protein